MHFDVFNGDADGICALIQLRLAQPLESTLVTGVKRDIQLLDKVIVNQGDTLTVLDISLQKNSHRVVDFLNSGAAIFYVDHHLAGDIPSHPGLTAIINTDSLVCTSLLVNKYLEGKFPLWAITAAFGDNLNGSAGQLAATLGVNNKNLESLNKLGVYINYNGYGSSIEDLHFPPDVLYREMVSYESPFEFIASNRVTYEKLENGFQQDMMSAKNIKPEFQNEAVGIYLLPDAPWARRVSGVFSNDLTNANPSRAHAVLTYNQEGGYLVSVRAPLCNKIGADEFCSGFSSGGGRKSAAGINHLPNDQLGCFVEKFAKFYARISG